MCGRYQVDGILGNDYVNNNDVGIAEFDESDMDVTFDIDVPNLPDNKVPRRRRNSAPLRDTIAVQHSELLNEIRLLRSETTEALNRIAVALEKIAEKCKYFLFIVIYLVLNKFKVFFFVENTYFA